MVSDADADVWWCLSVSAVHSKPYVSRLHATTIRWSQLNIFSTWVSHFLRCRPTKWWKWCASPGRGSVRGRTRWMAGRIGSCSYDESIRTLGTWIPQTNLVSVVSTSHSARGTISLWMFDEWPALTCWNVECFRMCVNLNTPALPLKAPNTVHDI